MAAPSDPHSHHSRLVDEDRLSVLQKCRLTSPHNLPNIFKSPVSAVPDVSTSVRVPADAEQLQKLFPATWGQPVLNFVESKDQHGLEGHTPLRMGIVLSGGQAPGGHNVIAGVYDYLKKVNKNSQLFGFLLGPRGIYEHSYIEITDTMMDKFRNQGGFDMIRSGRHKISSEEQLTASMAVARRLDLHGIVVVGGDDSNTNAAVLAEWFKRNDCKTKVVGVPKTIDGDLRNEFVETSFGFDTAVKTYAEFIGNLETDVATSGKYYHFVRLMGRAASNITLNCSIMTRPNLTFIGEEIQSKNSSLSDVLTEIVELIVKRQDLGKDFGVVLVPEGLIEFIPEFGVLISEINTIVAREHFSSELLTERSRKVFLSLPENIRAQITLDRDPHGNVQVSRIATERLLGIMVKEQLEKLDPARAKRFEPRTHFFGYEGRAGMPSLFDSDYCYSLGHCAAALIDSGATGYMALIKDLSKQVEEWSAGGCPLSLMMNIETRKGMPVPVIRKALVELDKPLFRLFAQAREAWKYEDLYCSPGPIQFYGPSSELRNPSLQLPSLEDLLPPREFGFAQLQSRHWFPKSLSQLSSLQLERLKAVPQTPPLLMDMNVRFEARRKHYSLDVQAQAMINAAFPLSVREHQHAIMCLVKKYAPPGTRLSGHLPRAKKEKPLRVGFLLNGQQAPGVANVLWGVWDRIVLEDPMGKVFGFRGGIEGFMQERPDYIEISRDDLQYIKNQGGFELLGRTKEAEMVLATDEGIEQTKKVCKELRLDGLVVVGGRYSVTNVAVLAEHLLSAGIPTRVIGVPVTQNNNIDTSLIEASIGFDSAAKCYSQLIGNLNTDGASCAKYWLFIRLMGADKSQIAVESALSTHPNLVLVSESCAAGDKSLQDVVADIASVVCTRAAQGLNFGSVLIPEGLVGALPQFKHLMSECKRILAFVEDSEKERVCEELINMDESSPSVRKLSPWTSGLLNSLPLYFRRQVIQPKSLGSVELTKIATEELLAELVLREVKEREHRGQATHCNFVPLCFYFGYQGRSSLPSEFDCSLGLSHGRLASLLIQNRLTGYITSLRGLSAPPTHWLPIAFPATTFLKPSIDERAVYPQKIPICPTDVVRLNGRVYTKLMGNLHKWESQDHYCSPGPIQFGGPTAAIVNCSLLEEHKKYLEMLEQTHKHVEKIRSCCVSGAPENLLHIVVSMLTILRNLHVDNASEVV